MLSIGNPKTSRKKKIIALILAITTVVGLSGCQKDENQDPLLSESKQSLVDMVNSTNNELITCYDRISELETLLKGVQGEKEPTPAISEMSDGTGRLTFNTVDGIITLPSEFKYPGSAQAPNTSSINISESVKITPTSNWTCKLTGTKLEVNHTSGIAGNITVGVLDREAQKTQAAELQAYLTEFFTGLPPETIKYSRLYLNDNWFGLDAVSHTFIDEKDAMIRCGILGYGEVSVQYFFVYKGERDAAKDEVILSLIKTLNVWNIQMSVE